MNNEPVAWEGAEEWEQLAWELCADECGEESCTDLIWDMGVIPEPWGERWQKYEYEAKRMIAMVRKYAHPVKEQLTDEKFDNIFANGKRLGVLETEDRFRKAMNLTDEEIDDFTVRIYNCRTGAEAHEIVLSILRKAQE